MKARLAGAALLLLPLAPAVGQPTPAQRVENAALNGAIGSASAGIAAAIKGRPIKPALLSGFGGGVLVSAGKQVAAADFSGSGLVGRQLSGLGLAFIRRAGNDTLKIPLLVGPVTLDLVPSADDRLRPRVNLTQSLTMVYYMVRHETSLDAAATLSTAAPTFRLPEIGFSTPWGLALGHMTMGTIVLGRETGSPVNAQTLRHESVHVLQLDDANEILGFPAERAVVRLLPGGDRIARYVDVGVVGHLLALALSTRISYDHHPWEREAYLLAGPWAETRGAPDPPHRH